MRFLSSIFSTPELEGYSDEQYERLVWQAKLRRGDAIWVIPLAFGLLAALIWIAFGAALTLGMRSLGASLSGLTLRGWGAANGVAALLIAVAAGAVIRWVMIVRSIRRIVNKAGCPFCEFSLVGLRVQHGWVRCPECGQKVFLHEHRLTADDLIPEHERFKPLPGAGPQGAYADKRPRQRTGR